MSDVTADSPTLTLEGFTPFAQIPRWILRNPHLSHGAVRLYGVIMTYADNETKAAFPSRETLAADIGASVATVKRYIRELEDMGAMVVTRRRNRKTGNFYANHYVLRFAEPVAGGGAVDSITPSRTHAATLSEPITPRVTDDPRRGVTDDPITRTTDLTTSTVVSPSMESRHEIVAPSVSTSETRRHAMNNNIKAEKADPISPEWYHSEERQLAIAYVGRMALHHSRGEDVEVGFVACDFEGLINKCFNLEDDSAADWLMWDRGWRPPKKAVDKLEAAIWLNKFLYALMEEHIELAFTPLPVAA